MKKKAHNTGTTVNRLPTLIGWPQSVLRRGTKPAPDGDTKPNYTILVGMTGKWQVTRFGSPLARMTERAILEKENLIIGAPEPEGDVEKP